MTTCTSGLAVRLVDDPPPGALLALADRLRHLAPSRHDPERFHAEKSAIEGELRRLALSPAPQRRR